MVTDPSLVELKQVRASRPAAVLIAALLSPTLAMAYLRDWRWFWAMLLGWPLLRLVQQFGGADGQQVLGLLVVWHTIGAIRAHHRAPLVPTAPDRWFRRPWPLVTLFLGFVLLLGFLGAAGGRVYRVPSSSMSPDLPPGSWVIASKWGFGYYDAFGVLWHRGPVTAELQRGDRVVYERPDPPDLVIARIIGLPNETVELRNGVVWIDGQALEQASLGTDAGTGAEIRSESGYRILRMARFPHHRDLAPLRLGADQYFLMGDHRDNVIDSRMFGPVSRAALIGRVSTIVWRGDWKR